MVTPGKQLDKGTWSFRGVSLKTDLWESCMHGPMGCIKAKEQKETTHVKIKTRRDQSSRGHSRGTHQQKQLRKGSKMGGKAKERRVPGAYEGMEDGSC